MKILKYLYNSLLIIPNKLFTIVLVLFINICAKIFLIVSNGLNHVIDLIILLSILLLFLIHKKYVRWILLFIAFLMLIMCIFSIVVLNYDQTIKPDSDSIYLYGLLLWSILFIIRLFRKDSRVYFKK